MGKTFYDFCVPYSEDEEKLAEILNELCTVGYTTVAVSQTFDHTKCSRKTNEIFPAPISLTNLKEKFKQTLTILSRLTILYSHQMITHDINISLNVKKFDLIVGVPTNVQALQHACSSFNGDMIGIVYDDKIKMCLINHRYYQMAARRGIYFEIQYSPVIRNSNHRKDIIVLAQNIVSHKKSNSVVITSGALNVFHVRGPYDVANLGLLFGLSEEQSKNAISNVCRSILQKAEGRRSGKTVVFAKNWLQQSSDEDSNLDDSDDSMEDGHPSKKMKCDL